MPSIFYSGVTRCDLFRTSSCFWDSFGFYCVFSHCSSCDYEPYQIDKWRKFNSIFVLKITFIFVFQNTTISILFVLTLSFIVFFSDNLKNCPCSLLKSCFLILKGSKQYEKVLDKLEALQKKYETREREMKEIMSTNSHLSATEEVAKENERLKMALKHKSEETAKFKLELDTMLQFLHSLKTQNVKLPISSASIREQPEAKVITWKRIWNLVWFPDQMIVDFVPFCVNCGF